MLVFSILAFHVIFILYYTKKVNDVLIPALNQACINFQLIVLQQAFIVICIIFQSL